MVCLAMGILYAIGFSILGIKFGFILGLSTGMLCLIPYVGPLIGAVASVILALSQQLGIPALLGLALVFVVVQLVEGFLLTPKLVGNKVGLSEFATMLALIIGGNLLGFMGMILAIPLAAILKSAIIELKSEYQKTEIYQG